MIKLRDYDVDYLYQNDTDINRTYKFETQIKEGEKFSIVLDAMFKTVFLNSKRIKNSAMLLSLIIECEFETILKNLKFTKNELDKERKKSKGQRADFVATLGDTILSIEMNNNSSVEDLNRNMDYAHNLFASKILESSKYNYSNVLQINLCNFSFKDYENTIDYIYPMNQDGIALTDKLVFVNIYLPNRQLCRILHN